MPRLTLRTLLAYIDDTLEATEARALGKKVAESEEARLLVERIKRVTRRRGLATPVPTDETDEVTDPNAVAEYLDNALDSPTVKQLEETCLASDVHLAEVAACHQILTLVLTEPVRVPPRAHRRMYELVQPPASIPSRKPSKTLPVGGAAPPGDAAAEPDDADAALLLGMKRYTSATTWAARFALFGAVAVLLVLLTGAALLSLAHQPAKPPETAGAHSSILNTPQPPPVAPDVRPKEPDVPDPKTPKAPDPIPVVVPPMPAPRMVDPGEVKPADPIPVLGPAVLPPSIKRAVIGRVETSRVLVLTQREPGSWLRLRPKADVKLDDDEPVYSNDPVMALPGYKANTVVGERGQQVEVHLWGNVPEQVPYRVLESRVKFHVPPAEFDADITLIAGRIYLKSKKLDSDKKPTGARVRLRVADEVWDVTLSNERSDVLVELISWFEPGTPYARKDGARPKLEGRVAVMLGTAGLSAPARFKKFDKLSEGTQVVWDSSSGTLSDPRPIDNPQEAARVPTLEGKFQVSLAKLLTEMADAAADPLGTRTALTTRLDPAVAVPNRDLVARLAVYAQTALADSSADGEDLLKPLVDVLRSQLPWEARQAVVTALVNWVARDRGNTAILRRVLVSKGVGEDKQDDDAADWVLRLLRGFVSPTKPDPGSLDLLVDKRDADTPALLADPEIAVREAALWNLLAVEQWAWVPRPVGVNVGAVGPKLSPEYMGFVTSWKKKVEGIKTRPPKK